MLKKLGSPVFLILLIFLYCKKDSTTFGSANLDIFSHRIMLPEGFRTLEDTQGVDFSVKRILSKNQDTIQIYLGLHPSFPEIYEREILPSKVYKLHEETGSYDMDKFYDKGSKSLVDRNRIQKYDYEFVTTKNNFNLRIIRLRDKRQGFFQIYIDSLNSSGHKLHLFVNDIDPETSEKLVEIFETL